MILPRSTRANDGSVDCNCNICLTARSHVKNKRIASEKIDCSTGLFGSSSISKLPNKAVDESKKRPSLTICKVCKQETGPGIRHKCSDRKSSNNIVEHVYTMPDMQQEQVITSLLKTKVEAGSSKDQTLSLSTKGSKARVSYNPTPGKSGMLFRAESLDQLQSHLNNISNNHMKKVAHWLRVHAGRASVEPGYKNHVTKKGQSLSDLYKISYHDFEGQDSGIQLPVIWADAEELLSAVTDARNIGSTSFVKVMADGGQGFLKICLTVLPENYDPDLDCAPTDIDMLSDNMSELSSPVKKRSLYRDGGGIGHYKLTSVKRVILLAIVPDCKETYHNMKTLFDLTCLNNISFLFVADFKLLLICLGCQTATASFPCPYCYVPLREITSSVHQENQDDDIFEVRTFGNLKIDAGRFNNDHGADKKKAKLCNSTVNKPLFDEHDSVEVFDKCPMM